MILLIDNYDSFTYNLYDYILQSGEQCLSCRNDEITLKEIDEMQPDAFVFSPGPKRPADHPLMFDILKMYYQTKPILGICLGHQAIGEFFGARLVRSAIPAHGKTLDVYHDQSSMYKNIPSPVTVGRYHSLILAEPLPDELTVTAQGKEGLVMSFVHKNLPLWGMQFHPESVLTQHGLRMIRNWVDQFQEKEITNF